MLKKQLELRGATPFVTPLGHILTPLKKKDIVPGMRFPISHTMTFSVNQQHSIVFLDETDSAMLPLSALTRKVKDIHGNTHYSKGDLDNAVDYSLLDKKSTIVIEWVEAHQCYNKVGNVYFKHTFGYHLE